VQNFPGAQIARECPFYQYPTAPQQFRATRGACGPVFQKRESRGDTLSETSEAPPARGLSELDPARQVFEETLGRDRQGRRLEARAVLVLGAGQRASPDEDPPLGNGRAISLLCAREGASVACADKDVDAAEETARLIRQTGGTASVIGVDVAQPDQIGRAIELVRTAMGRLDGLVLNVGVGGPQTLAAQTVESWDETLAINLRSHMWACKCALPVMEPGSSIVFISSVASLRPGTRVPSYDTSKAALAALCRHVAMEGEALGIRANVLAPGPIDTPLGRDASRGRPARAVQRLPFGREGTAWEVAHAVCFLLAHESSLINAQVIVADGGMTGLHLR
jgi:NAD(P)-dependent dehydrogenase (short-subunit alcohol dehydrogenase family)